MPTGITQRKRPDIAGDGIPDNRTLRELPILRSSRPADLVSPDRAYVRSPLIFPVDILLPAFQKAKRRRDRPPQYHIRNRYTAFHAAESRKGKPIQY